MHRCHHPQDRMPNGGPTSEIGRRVTCSVAPGSKPAILPFQIFVPKPSLFGGPKSLSMCGRYSITLPPEAVHHLFQTHGELPNWPAYYNAAPTTALPVARQAKEGVASWC
jgi:hypothetical protein